MKREIKNIVREALREDLGKGDVTTFNIILAGLRVDAAIIAKEDGALCGMGAVREIFTHATKQVKFGSLKKDGQLFKKNDKIAVISGSARQILVRERTALNILALLSGVATLTKKFVDKCRGTKVKIMDTRKTTPNLRALEKYAVRAGGGFNHRKRLDEAVLIKDNHLRAGAFIYRGKLNKEKFSKMFFRLKEKVSCAIEVEVENLAEFMCVAECGPDMILLDNFSLANLRKAVGLRNKLYPKIKLEASGGINLNNVRKVALTGVEMISVGALTHSPKSIDLSLEIIDKK